MNSAPKKRLLALHPAIAPYRIDFFNTIAEHFDSTICFYSKSIDDNKFGYETVLGQLMFQPQFMADSFKDLSLLRKLRLCWKLYKKTRPDIVLVTESGIIPLLFVLIKLFDFNRHFRLVSMIDDSYNMIAGNNQFSKWHNIGEKVLVPFFDETILVEPKVAEYFKKRWSKGICFPILQDEARLRSVCQKAMPLTEKLISKYHLEGCRVMLFVGRLIDLKQPDIAAETFLRVASPTDRFAVVGEGPLKGKLQKIADRDSRVIVIGRQEGQNLFAWYDLASVFILPSKLEPFGAVTNEALIAGCYAIVSSHAGSSCLVIPGENGELVNPENLTELSETIRKALETAAPTKLPLQMKKNLMPYTFNDKINDVVRGLGGYS